MTNDNLAKFERIAEQVENRRAELGVPGATFGLMINGESYTGGVGITHAQHPLPVTDETLFQIGSITKTVTATAMMRLVEQGKLDMESPVRDYLPEFRVRDEKVSEGVRVWHLLTHLAGWTGDVFSDTGDNDDAAERYVADMADFEQLAPLGEVFSYNNASFCVAGRIIETLTGLTFEAAIQAMIFAPLGMERSFFFPKQVMLHRFAVGHQLTETATKVLSPWAIPRGMNAAGGISCHIKDLLRYGAYHLGDGSPLLRRESLEYMQRMHTSAMPYMGSCGLSWMRSRHSGRDLIWHTGGTNGQNAVLALVPECQLSLGMMTNGETGTALHEWYMKTVLRDFLDIEIPEPQVVDSTAAELAQYIGRYRGTMRAIELDLESGGLRAAIVMRGGMPSDRERIDIPPAPVARCGVDQLLLLEGEFKGTRADFIRDESGTIRYLRFGSRIHVRQ